MATILLSAAGAAIGSGFGGSVLGLSGAVIGRAVGATIGRSIDQRILGSGSDPVEVGKVDRFRLSGVGYGTPIQEVWGRMRVAGEIIWASRFQENRQTQSSGKGAPRATATTTSLSYSVSLAIALCRGEALRVGRVWADGVEISPNSLDLRFYPGSESQLPDPKIEAVEGAGLAPTYRGIAYVVIEDLSLSRFGNRVPQFSFEVVRRATVKNASEPRDLAAAINAVAMFPGTGEYALATTPVHFSRGKGQNVSANVHSVLGETDFASSLKQLNEELPNCQSVSLVVSWFGSDLRCSQCQIRPKVEQQESDGVEMPWIVSGTNRAAAALVPAASGRPVYGGTPADRSVIEAINAIRDSGKEVMFYPFILMDQDANNGLSDPWMASPDQPAFPWRGRITLTLAPGVPGSTDQTFAAATELQAFLGNAAATDFVETPNGVSYVGPTEWSYRRFILHYAHLCAAAGGVDAFCIGSEMRGLTQVRSGANVFPMVTSLKVLAAEVRSILGSQTKISYAADWSEYFGLHAGDNVFFNMDPLWADPNIDFIGIDNYMPISDWRDTKDNADSEWGTIYSRDYLEANIAGGEGYDWFYDSAESSVNQFRTPISDAAHGEDWVFRNKDIKNWWASEHHERLNGVRQTVVTAWTPGMKPVRFTEYGCAALDKSTNQPNKFLDTKSSESELPTDSNGRRDDYLQSQYYLAMAKFWSDSSNNPSSDLYNGKMVDFNRSHAWAWDSRPFPDFPGATAIWSDGQNYTKGHWLNGRVTNQPLSLVVAEITADLGIDEQLDLNCLHGILRGFSTTESATARSKLQTLALAFGIDIAEAEGVLRFLSRDCTMFLALDGVDFVATKNTSERREMTKGSSQDLTDRVRVTYVEAENDFEIQTAEATFLDAIGGGGVETEVALLLTSVEANSIAERSLVGARLAKDGVKFSLPLSQISLVAGNFVELEGVSYRIDSVDESQWLDFDATRADFDPNGSNPERGESPTRVAVAATTPVFVTFLDLPLLRGDETPQAPHIALAVSPWPNQVSVWSSPSDSGYTLNTNVEVPAIIGTTLSPIPRAKPGLWDRGTVFHVTIPVGDLSSVSELAVLNGANVAAIGDGSTDNWEIMQFAEANLVSENTYEIKSLLRGQSGSDAIVPENWPAGSILVILDGLVPQIELPLSARGLDRYYRVGASELGYTDVNVGRLVAAFDGIGFRPYSVAHLQSAVTAFGDIFIEWVRRTRIDGDSWQSIEVPLGEESEVYSMTVTKNLVVVRQELSFVPSWTYTMVDQLADAISVPFEISVAQTSTIFGAGPSRTIIFE